jgi:ribosomal-protein-alanine N-acetyltransferase
MKPIEPAFRLRRMHSQDLDAVHAMEELIFPTPWSLNSYKFELEQNTASQQWIIEAAQDGANWELAAYTVCWMLGDEVHVANLAVAPAYRRLGLARSLLGYVLTRATREGMHSATLEVRAGNRAAQDLYTSFGFETVATRKAYYKDNQEDALLMQLPHLETIPATADRRVAMELEY